MVYDSWQMNCLGEIPKKIANKLLKTPVKTDSQFVRKLLDNADNAE